MTTARAQVIGIAAAAMLLLIYWFIVGADDLIRAMEPCQQIENHLTMKGE